MASDAQRMVPRGWLDRPSPLWPSAPPGWNFGVLEHLKMWPLDLSQNIDLGPAAQLSQARLNEITQSAADAVAWHLCTSAAEKGLSPMTLYLRNRNSADTVLAEVGRRIFGPLLDGARKWIGELPEGSTEWRAAIATVKPFIDCRDAFIGQSSQRIRVVLEASCSARTGATKL